MARRSALRLREAQPRISEPDAVDSIETILFARSVDVFSTRILTARLRYQEFPKTFTSYLEKTGMATNYVGLHDLATGVLSSACLCPIVRECCPKKAHDISHLFVFASDLRLASEMKINSTLDIERWDHPKLHNTIQSAFARSPLLSHFSRDEIDVHVRAYDVKAFVWLESSRAINSLVHSQE